MKPTGRYKTAGNIEDIYYPDTHILINKLNIQNDSDLQIAEKQALQECIKYFSAKEITIFDSKLICDIHYQFLRKLYEWAGKYRSVDIAKGNTRFAVPQFVPKLMADLDIKIKKDNYLTDSKKDVFVAKLAYYKCELIAIHPFREGNGRTIRLFCDLLARKNGYGFFNYPNSTAFVKKYMQASIAGVIKNNIEPMKIILNDCLNDHNLEQP